METILGENHKWGVSRSLRDFGRVEYPTTVEALYLSVLEYIGVECDSLTPQAIADLCAACYRPLKEDM